MKTTQLDVSPEHQLQPRDTARTGAPDPAWPIEKRLRWYQVYSHVLLLNVSERTRRAAAGEADRETA